MMIKSALEKIYPYAVFVVIVGVLLSGLLFSGEISAGIADGVTLCLNTLIPSLFFFMILANIIGNSILAELLARPFLWFSRRVLRLDGKLFSIWILSLLGGYPVGAKLIGDQLRAGRITQQTAKHLLPICVNCSPAFLVSYVALKFWGSLTLGVLLFVSQILACLIIAIVTGWGHPLYRTTSSSESTYPPPSILLVDAVVGATKTMGVICGFVLAFSALFPLLAYLPLSETQQFYLRGGLEVVSGVQSLSGVSLINSILLASLFTAFGGLCVFLQVFAMLRGSGISFLYFFALRLCYTVLSVVLTWVGLHLLPPSAVISTATIRDATVPGGILTLQPFHHSLPVAIGLLLSGALLLTGAISRPTPGGEAHS